MKRLAEQRVLTLIPKGRNNLAGSNRKYIRLNTVEYGLGGLYCWNGMKLFRFSDFLKEICTALNCIAVCAVSG